MFILSTLLSEYVKPAFDLSNLFSLLIFFGFIILCYFISKKSSATYAFITFVFICFIFAGLENILVILQTKVESLKENETLNKIILEYNKYFFYEVSISSNFMTFIRSLIPDGNDVTKNIGQFLYDYSCSVYFGYMIFWILATLRQRSKNKKRLAKIEF